MEKDKEAIEASFATQYGIRLEKERDMSFREYTVLLGGLMADTPLGQLVLARMKEKSETSWEKEVKEDWQRFCLGKKHYQQFTKSEKELVNLQKRLAMLFSGKGGVK